MKKRLTEERGALVQKMQAMLKKCNDEQRDLTPEENTEFDTHHKRAEDIKGQLDRYEQFEKLATSAKPTEQRQQPGRDDIGTPEQQDEQRAKLEADAFRSYLRGTVTNEQRDYLTSGSENRAALSTSAIGVVGTRDFSTQLVEAMKHFAGVREAGAFILKTQTGNEFVLPTGDDTANEANIKAENAEETGTTEPTIGNVTLNAFTYSSELILVPRELLQDNQFNLEDYLVRMAAQRIGRKLNKDTTNGDGNGKPRGFTVAASVGKTTASTSAVTYEELLDTVHSVNSAYRQNRATLGWQIADQTLAAIRKLKDGSGAYIWAAGSAGAPDTLLGYRYTINDDLDTLADGAASVIAAFGDWSHYWVRDVGNVEVLRLEERFAEKRQVAFYAFSRHDGDLTNTSAIKLLQTAAG